MKKIFTIIAATMMAVCANAQAAYSWESAEGTVIENGGKIEQKNGADVRLNYENTAGGKKYYTICLSGKKANMSDTEASANASHMVLTLDNAIATGDKLTITAYYNKGEEKKVSAYFLFENGTEFTTGCDFPDIKNGGEPKTMSYDIPAEAAGSKTIKITRGDAGTNLFITKLIIGSSTTGISDIVVEKAQNDAIYNIAGQRVSGSAKGLVIKNGKKYFVK